MFSSADIYRRVWKDEPFSAEGTVPVHIRHLREKLEIDPANPRYLKVVWGKGYKLEEMKKQKKALMQFIVCVNWLKPLEDLK